MSMIIIYIDKDESVFPHKLLYILTALNRLLSLIEVKQNTPMNQTRRVDKPKPSQANAPSNTNRRPKRCLVCKKMFAFDKFVNQTCILERAPGGMYKAGAEAHRGEQDETETNKKLLKL